MKELNRVDMGSIKIHKKVLADITASVVKEVDGVSLMPKTLLHTVGDYLGWAQQPGIRVDVDAQNQVTIEVKVFVRYGQNIPDLARHTQDMIRGMIEQTVDVDLKDVHLSVQGIERGVK